MAVKAAVMPAVPVTISLMRGKLHVTVAGLPDVQAIHQDAHVQAAAADIF